MERLIINNKSDLPMEVCLDLCRRVVRQGRISANGTQYCYASRFYCDGLFYVVHANINKGSDSFTIYRDGEADTQ